MTPLTRSFFAILLVLLSQAVSGQKRAISIPFTLTEYNNLSVQAILNKKDTVHLLFHTAASAVTLTEEATRKAKELVFEGADSVKSWGGEGNASRFSKGNALQIGALNWDNLVISEDKNSARDTDGKFGMNLFAHKVVELDFDKKRILLHTSLPRKARKYEKLNLLFENDLLFIEAIGEIGDMAYKNRFLIHSGYSGALLLDDNYVSENKIDGKLKVVDEKELKDSFGHILKIKKAILPALLIGKEKLNDVPVGFFPGALGRQKMSILGGDILKRFNIIIDADRKYIYLKPNSLNGMRYQS